MAIGHPASFVVGNSTISGGLTITGNSATDIFVDSNAVGGNLRFDDNSSGQNVVSSSVINGVLGCDGNTPPPTGSNTTAARRGECAGL